MKITPALFNGEMIRALINDRKTQTRRPIKLPVIDRTIGCELSGCEIAGEINSGDYRNSLFGQPGDLLWVRETFTPAGNEDGHPVDSCGNLCTLEKAERFYRADTSAAPYGLEATADGRQLDVCWTPSIHMPRWASRLTLRITDVRVERLQDISESDAIAEGAQHFPQIPLHPCHRRLPKQAPRWSMGQPASTGETLGTARHAFGSAWNSIYAGRGFAWMANPWVWALTFTVYQQNVDTLARYLQTQRNRKEFEEQFAGMCS